MAANYWESTQRRHWQFTRQQLEDLRKKLEDEDQNLVQMYPLPQLRHLSIYFNQRECNLHCYAGTPTSELMFLQYRDFSTRETPWRTTAGNGHSPVIYSSILFESRDQTDQPILGNCNGSISGLQNGGMSTSY
jgi:hypothetical protein